MSLDLQLPEQPFSYGTRKLEMGPERQIPLMVATERAFNDDSIATTLAHGQLNVASFYADHPEFMPPVEDTRPPVIPRDSGSTLADLGVSHLSRTKLEAALYDSIEGLSVARDMASAIVGDAFRGDVKPVLLFGVREVKYGGQRSIDWHIDDASTYGAASIDITPPEAAEPDEPVAEVMAVKLHPSMPKRRFGEVNHIISEWIQIPSIEDRIEEEQIPYAKATLYPGSVAFFPFGSAHAVRSLVDGRAAVVMATHMMGLSRHKLDATKNVRNMYHGRPDRLLMKDIDLGAMRRPLIGIPLPEL